MQDAKERKPQKNNEAKEYNPTFFPPPLGLAGIAYLFAFSRTENAQPTKATEDKNIHLKQL